MVLLSLIYLHYSNPGLLAPKRVEPQGHSMEEQSSHDHSDVGGCQLLSELWRCADLHSTDDLRCDQVHFAFYFKIVDINRLLPNSFLLLMTAQIFNVVVAGTGQELLAAHDDLFDLRGKHLRARRWLVLFDLVLQEVIVVR